MFCSPDICPPFTACVEEAAADELLYTSLERLNRVCVGQKAGTLDIIVVRGGL
jgi:hypothetical protein